MKLKGKVFQIIKSDKKEDFLLPSYLFEDGLEDYDVVQISINDKMSLKEYKKWWRMFDNSIFLSWIVKLIDGKRRPEIEVVLMKNSDFKLGQEVEIEVEKFLQPTDIFIKQEKAE